MKMKGKSSMEKFKNSKKLGTMRFLENNGNQQEIDKTSMQADSSNVGTCSKIFEIV